MLAFFARLILFMIAISVIRSVLRFVQQFLSGGSKESPLRASRQNPSPVSDTTLHQDPVCGTYVAVDTSLKKVVKGRVLHFCSEECRDRYSA